MSRLKWTYERCKEEVSKMVYLKELQGTSVVSVMRKNGWFDELTTHLIRVQSKPFTKEQCAEEAKKYSTRTEFQKKANGPYSAAFRMEIIDEICEHMGKPLNQKKYTKEEILNSALKYENQRDWSKNEISIYRCAKGYQKTDIEFWEKCISHMEYIFKPNGYWTYERCSEIASKYNSLNKFQKEQRLVFDAIKRHKWDDLISHMEYLTPNGNKRRYSYEFDTLEKCKKESLKYKTIGELATKCSLLYKKIHKNDWDVECFSHMEPQGGTQKRFIYVFEFKETNHAYVGLTCDIERRKDAHYFGRDKKFGEVTSNVHNHMIEHNIEPVFKIITKRPVKEKNAKASESKWMDHYKKNGWILLNIAKAGSLGGNRGKSYNYYLKIRNECTTLSEFSRILTSFDKKKLRRDGLWDQLIEGLEVDVNNWTVENIYKEYPKYKGLNRSQLQKQMPGLYKAIHGHELMGELFPIKERGLSYEYCKEVALQYEYYSEFRKKSSAVYNTCLNKKWYELTAHMKKGVTLNRKVIVSKYTYEKCQELAKECSTRSEFEKKYSGAFKFLKNNSLLDDLFPKTKRVFKSKYTYEDCQELAKGCKTRSDFQEKYSGAFKFLGKNGLLDDLYPKNLENDCSVNGYRSKNIILNPITGVFYTMTELTELFCLPRKSISRLIKNGKTVDKLKETFIIV